MTVPGRKEELLGHIRDTDSKLRAMMHFLEMKSAPSMELSREQKMALRQWNSEHREDWQRVKIEKGLANNPLLVSGDPIRVRLEGVCNLLC